MVSEMVASAPSTTAVSSGHSSRSRTAPPLSRFASFLVPDQDDLVTPFHVLLQLDLYHALPAQPPVEVFVQVPEGDPRRRVDLHHAPIGS